jgi:phospholipid-translocating ATPase
MNSTIFCFSCDQDVSDSYSVRYPKLYQPGHVNLFFNKRVFAESVAEGILSSAVLFFVPYAALQDAVQANGTDAASFQSFGTVVSSILIIVVSLRVSLNSTHAPRLLVTRIRHAQLNAC